VNRARKQIPLRLDPAVHDALARWAADELRSLNAQIELILRRALGEAGRMPKQANEIPRRGRPPTRTDERVDLDLDTLDPSPAGDRTQA
jgi:hypothetical protein